MWVGKRKCKKCKEWFKSPENDFDLIQALWVNFCSKSCRRTYIAMKNNEKNEKLKLKKQKKKEKKQNSISSLTKKADKLWSECVKIRDWYECVYCGKKEHLNSHHIIWRSNKVMRWDLRNWITLCCLHHTFGSEFSAHKQPLLFTRWLEETQWTKFVDNLLFQGRAIIKNTPDRIKVEIDSLELYKKLEQEKLQQ